MTPIRLWTHRPTLPADQRRDWVASLPEGAPNKILATASTVTGWVVASVGLLSVRTVPAAESWCHTPWHEIEHGGWNDELDRLSWTKVTGRRGSVQLVDAGKVPEVFRERVKASIVFEQDVPVTESSGITISARRNLADSRASLNWHATLQRGLTWNTAGVRDLADQALERYRSEFDPD